MNFEASDRLKFAASILAAAILSSGLTLGLYKFGSGLAARSVPPPKMQLQIMRSGI